MFYPWSPKRQPNTNKNGTKQNNPPTKTSPKSNTNTKQNRGRRGGRGGGNDKAANWGNQRILHPGSPQEPEYIQIQNKGNKNQQDTNHPQNTKKQQPPEPSAGTPNKTQQNQNKTVYIGEQI